MNVIKRDGEIVTFEKNKIKNAIQKAFLDVDGDVTEYASNKAREIANYISDKNIDMSVEEIQDIVEEKLMASNRKDVARAYIIYRNDRNRSRLINNDLMRRVSEKIKASNIENQNANVDEHSFGGRVGAASSEVMKQYALDNCMSEMARNNHLNNEIYIHDLDHYAIGDHNCLTIPFDDLLANGFITRQTDVRPAQSVNTAMQLVAVIFQLQSLQQFGGVSASHLDWTMIPYVRKSFLKHYMDGANWIADIVIHEDIPNDAAIDDENVYCIDSETYRYAMEMTRREVHQSVEGLYHNLNTLQSRSGNQLPFTSINYGTCTLPEGRMIIRALLEVSINGVGSLHKTPVFPCGIWQSAEGINRKSGDPNYDLYRLALRSTAQRLYPNYANVNWSGNAGYDKNDPRTYFATMGCRTANGYDINGFGQLKDGRGNICPVTIIMPTLAMQVKERVLKYRNLERIFNGDVDDTYKNDRVKFFLELLDKKIHEAKDMLLERFEYICSQSPDSAKFMYMNNTMCGFDGETIRSAMKHGTLAIGQLGLAETLQILIGCDHTTDKGMELAKKIEELFSVRCKEFKEKYKLNFGVYYSPAENLCFTSMKRFKAKYGEIKNVSDKKFFTNSMHVPVWKNVTPFEKIDIESQLTGYSSAGCITYVELNAGVKNNIDALEQIVNYAMEKDIPYFAVNVPNDCCNDCGYTDEIGNECPVCGGTHITRLRRVTGYLTGNYTTAFNEGKQQEVEMRVKHANV